MNPYLLSAIIALALVSTAQYFLGSRKNRWISARMSKQLEEALKPTNTNYTNIGGVIGYNFAYSMPAPFTNAKGTMTLSPRHSLLYLPFSLALGVGDRLLVNVFTKKKLAGEAHLVRASYLRRARIEGAEGMERSSVSSHGLEFVILHKGKDQAGELTALLEALPDPSALRHFCSYPDNKTFFVHLRPKSGDLGGAMDAVYKRLPRFFADS